MVQHDTHASLSVAVVGQRGSGKSTLIGHLRHQCGCVSQADLDMATEAATLADKPSLRFAWLNDKRSTERTREMTMQATDSLLGTTKYDLTLVDTPGDHTNIKHAISALATTDHAIVVVDAQTGAFEAGMVDDGPTKELLLVAFTMRIKQLIVAVNKMDVATHERFVQIQETVHSYVRKLGFQTLNVQYIPVSGMNGTNLVQNELTWYDGPSLVEAMDRLVLPERAIDKPFRLPIHSVYTLADGGVVVTGRIQTGSVRRGMRVSFACSRVEGTVYSIESHHRPLSAAYAGMTVGIKFMNHKADHVKRGDVASSALCDEALWVKSFTAQLVFLKHPVTKKVQQGYAPIIHCHNVQMTCGVRWMAAKVDRRTGKRLEKPTQLTDNEWLETLTAGDACEIEFRAHEKSLSLEMFREYSSLGRVVVRDSGITIAVGIIRSVEKEISSCRW